MLWLLQCLDGESSSGESPVRHIRPIGQFLLSRLFSSLTSSVLRSGSSWVSSVVWCLLHFWWMTSCTYDMPRSALETYHGASTMELLSKSSPDEIWENQQTPCPESPANTRKSHLQKTVCSKFISPADPTCDALITCSGYAKCISCVQQGNKSTSQKVSGNTEIETNDKQNIFCAHEELSISHLLHELTDLLVSWHKVHVTCLPHLTLSLNDCQMKSTNYEARD
jgi:hypothetical protein